MDGPLQEWVNDNPHSKQIDEGGNNVYGDGPY